MGSEFVAVVERFHGTALSGVRLYEQAMIFLRAVLFHTRGLSTPAESDMSWWVMVLGVVSSGDLRICRNLDVAVAITVGPAAVECPSETTRDDSFVLPGCPGRLTVMISLSCIVVTGVSLFSEEVHQENESAHVDLFRVVLK